MHRTGSLLSHPTHSSRDAACGDAKLVPLGELACTDRTLRQSSQTRIVRTAHLLEMPHVVVQPLRGLRFPQLHPREAPDGNGSIHQLASSGNELIGA